jgi:hypothetical protein
MKKYFFAHFYPLPQNRLQNRHHHSQYNLCSRSFNSVDELSSQNSYRQQQQRQQSFDDHHHWPKFIPKSPSSCSMNSYRFNRNHNLSFDGSPRRYKMIEEFDLEKIERERRKSHTSLFENGDVSMNYGTAV